jgi:hypothetical protein
LNKADGELMLHGESNPRPEHFLRLRATFGTVFEWPATGNYPDSDS